MRMTASRIRSINRAIARVQSTAWIVSRKNPHQPTNVSAFPATVIAGTVKVVAVPRAAAS
jgi:hypothetical protein